MSDIAIVATRDKRSEETLVVRLIKNGCEVITIKPDPKSILTELNKVSQRKGLQKTYLFVDKVVAEYARNAAMFLGLKTGTEIIEMYYKASKKGGHHEEDRW